MKALVISGPTASGKTALSVECAKRLNGEIISADALLIYKGLNIGTAKPSEGEMGGIPHYMIDVVAPTESFSASDYERLALPILKDIVARGKVPVLVGGTSFYLDALLYQRTLGGAPADEASTPPPPKYCTPMTKSASSARLKYTKSRESASPNSTTSASPAFPSSRWGWTTPGRSSMPASMPASTG